MPQRKLFEKQLFFPHNQRARILDDNLYFILFIYFCAITKIKASLSEMTSTSTSPLPLSQDDMKWWRSHLTDQMEGTVLRVIHSLPPRPPATAWIPSSFSFTFLSTPPAFATSASTYWIAIFATELIDVEKAIIRASRSGNRVLVEVGRRQAVFWENSPSPGHREQWVPASESQRSLPAIFKTFTHGPLVLRS